MKTNVSLSIRSIFAAMGLVSFAVTGWGATATRTSSFTYDANTGLLLSEAVEPDNASLCLTTNYTYDTYGNKLSTTTANCAGASGDAVFTSRSATAAFASAGSGTTLTQLGQFPTTVSNALGQSESKQYDNRFGSVASLTGPNALTTTWQFDSFGRKTRELRADGTQTKWEYLYCAGKASGTAVCPTVGGISGAWVVVTTPLASDGVTQNGPFVKVYFDQLGRELRQETQGFDGTGTAPSVYKDTEYNALGQVSRVSRPYQSGQTSYWVTYAYDAIGRLTSATQPDGAVTQTSYSGFTTVVTNAKGQTQTTVRNSQGQTVSSKDALNQQVTYAYDSFANLISTTDAAGNVTRLSYDVRGRKTQMVDPDLGTWTYVYNALDELVKQTDAKSQLATLTYDKLGRLVTRSEPDLISNWYYDTYKGGSACAKGVGKLCQSETTTGYNRTLSYDTLGRFVSAATTIGSSMSDSVSYDAQGRVATRTYPGGVVVAYVYSSLGYLKEVRRNNSSGALLWSANTLDAEGHVLNQTFGNNVSVTQSFDVRNGRVTAQTAGAGNAVQNVTYAYDTLGNVTNRNDGTQSLVETFAYDTLNRVTSATVNSSGAGIVTQNYGYNSTTGNLTSRSDLGTYTYPAAGTSRVHAVNQVTLTAGGSRSYTYDANGNMTAQTVRNSATTTASSAYVYTSFNMPSSMTSTSSGVTSSEALTYGPEHQRVKKVSSLNGTTLYLNPGNSGDLFYEKTVNNSGAIEERSYIRAAGGIIGVIKTFGGTQSTTTPATPSYSCPSGSILSGTRCLSGAVKLVSQPYFGTTPFPATDLSCQAAGIAIVNNWNSQLPNHKISIGKNGCTSQTIAVGSTVSIYADYNRGNWNVPITEIVAQYDVPATVSYTCSKGVVSGNLCVITNTGVASSTTNDPLAQVIYTCPKGQTLSGTTCLMNNGTLTNSLFGQYQTFPTLSNSCAHVAAAIVKNWNTQLPNLPISAGSKGCSSAPVQAGSTVNIYANYNGGDWQTTVLSINASSVVIQSPATANYVCTSGLLVGAGPTSRCITSGEQVEYFHRDALGSVVVITDSQGVVAERLSYDVFGQRRFISGGAADVVTRPYGQHTAKGYTGHEHLDSLGLIHMNGRVYDPVIARFMSADPYIQAPMNSQSYNRYSYVMNNPLAYSDPSGYLRIGGWSVSTSSVIRTAAAIAVAYYAPEISNYVGWTSGATAATGATTVAAGTGAAAVGITSNAVATGMLGGALSGAIMTNSLQGAVIGGVTGGAFGWAGDVGAANGKYGFDHFAAHAAVGCGSGVVNGSGCGVGAVSSMAGLQGTQYGFIGAVVAGGTVSVIGGGKFSNGATTAAFGYLFNQMLHPGGLSPQMKAYAQANGWIDENGVLIDTSSQMRQSAANMADTVSSTLAYATAACTSSVVCAPAAPGLAAAGVGVGAVGNFVFSTNPSGFVFDAAIDKALSGIGSVFQIPALITTTISEGIKNSPEISTLKNSQPMGK